MTESLLLSNRRVALLLGLLGGIALLFGGSGAWNATSVVGRILSWSVVAGAVAWIGMAVWFAWRPRLAYRDGMLLVYLRSGAPLAVPMEVVEVCFMGQGPISGTDPRNTPQPDQRVAANVVVRLAEAARDWHHRAANPALGIWQEGYITVRGLWCEPLNRQVMHRLNHRIVEIKRDIKRHTPSSCGESVASTWGAAECQLDSAVVKTAQRTESTPDSEESSP